MGSLGPQKHDGYAAGTPKLYPLYLTTELPSVVGVPLAVLLTETVLDVGKGCYQPWWAFGADRA